MTNATRMMNDERGMMNNETARRRPATMYSPFIVQPSSFIALRRTRGITLLEVLVSVFVLTLGILGLTMLIPVAQRQITDAARLDRGAAVGRAAFREIQVRGFLNPQNWACYDPRFTGSLGTPVLVNNPGSFSIPMRHQLNSSEVTGGGVSPTLISPPFVLDPLAMSFPANMPTGVNTLPPTYRFPYGVHETNAPPLARYTLDLRGVSQFLVGTVSSIDYYAASYGALAGNVGTAYLNAPLPFPLAERIFRSTDELVVIQPADLSLRPLLGSVHSGATSPSVPVQTSFEGNISWFGTVSISLNEIIGVTQNSDVGPRQYDVAVVVVQNRALAATPIGTGPTPPERDDSIDTADVPGERMVMADLVSGGRSGGEIILRVADNSTAEVNKRGWLNCRPGEWIMLTTWVRDDTLNRNVGGALVYDQNPAINQSTGDRWKADYWHRKSCNS